MSSDTYYRKSKPTVAGVQTSGNAKQRRKVRREGMKALFLIRKQREESDDNRTTC